MSRKLTTRRMALSTAPLPRGRCQALSWAQPHALAIMEEVIALSPEHEVPSSATAQAVDGTKTKAHASLAQVAALLLDPVPASRLAPGDSLDLATHQFRKR